MNIYTAYEQMKSSKEILIEAMKAEFPIGCNVNFHIMHGQKKPSTGIVSAHGGEGYLRIKHDQAKPNSRYSYRTVRFDKVIRNFLEEEQK